MASLVSDEVFTAALLELAALYEAMTDKPARGAAAPLSSNA